MNYLIEFYVYINIVLLVYTLCAKILFCFFYLFFGGGEDWFEKTVKGKPWKTPCRIVDFPIPADHRVKIKESENRQILWAFRELRKLWIMGVMVIPIVVGALGTVPKGCRKSFKKLEEELRPFKLQHFLNRLEYREESRRPEEICCHPDSRERPPANASGKNSMYWNLEIQTDHLISTRQPELVIVSKKEYLPNSGLCCFGWSQGKTERKRKERQVPRPCYGIEKKLWNMKVTVISIVISAFGPITKGVIKELEDLEIRGQKETI